MRWIRGVARGFCFIATALLAGCAARMDHYPTWVFLALSAVIGVTADAGFKSFQEEVE